MRTLVALLFSAYAAVGGQLVMKGKAPVPVNTKLDLALRRIDVPFTETRGETIKGAFTRTRVSPIWYREYNPQVVWPMTSIGPVSVSGNKVSELADGNAVVCFSTPYGIMTKRWCIKTGGGLSFTDTGYAEGTLGYSLQNGMTPHYAGKYDESQWRFTNTYNRNPNCWMKDLDMTGLSTGAYANRYVYDTPPVPDAGPNRSGFDCILISPSCAITAWHCINGTDVDVVGYAPGNGETTPFIAADGTVHISKATTFWNVSKAVKASDPGNPGYDLCLVILDTPLPPDIHPFQMIPPCFTNYVPNTGSSGYPILNGIPVMWLRNNTQKMNIQYLGGESINWPWMDYDRDPYSDSYELGSSATYPRVLFTEHDANGGDSGGPAFAVLKDDPLPALVLVIHGPVFGPTYWSSYDWITNKIFQTCGEKVHEIDLSKYPKLEDLP